MCFTLHTDEPTGRKPLTPACNGVLVRPQRHSDVAIGSTLRSQQHNPGTQAKPSACGVRPPTKRERIEFVQFNGNG